MFFEVTLHLRKEKRVEVVLATEIMIGEHHMMLAYKPGEPCGEVVYLRLKDLLKFEVMPLCKS